jgi:gluconolactonase
LKIFQLVIIAATLLQAAGPAWDGRGTLYFTDEHRITLRNSAGQFHVFREPSNDGSGPLFDAQGRLMVCESATSRVIRIFAPLLTPYIASHAGWS